MTAFWPMALAAELLESGAEPYERILKFIDEEIKNCVRSFVPIWQHRIP